MIAHRPVWHAAASSTLSGGRSRLGEPLASLLGVQGDVEAQEELLEARRVLDLDLQVADRVHHPVLVVLHLEADQEAAGALEVRALEGELDAARQLAAPVALRRGR